jgi:diguanylate cyclase (GGDEF)-like protein
MKIEIDLPENLYNDAKAYVKNCYFSDDISEWVKGIIHIELSAKCRPGYEIDKTTTCKTRNLLKADIGAALFGSGWNDKTIYQEQFLCIDIDNFNSFNDKYSMGEGHKALADIAKALQKIYSEKNVYRFNGDEFVVIAKNCEVKIPETNYDIKLKYSIVNIEMQRNGRRSRYLENEIMYFLDKGILESTFEGTQLSNFNLM